MLLNEDQLIEDAFRTGYQAGRVTRALSPPPTVDQVYLGWQDDQQESLEMIERPRCPMCDGSGKDPWADYVIEQGTDGGPYEHPEYCRICEGRGRVSSDDFKGYLTSVFHETGQWENLANMREEKIEAMAKQHEREHEAYLNGLM